MNSLQDRIAQFQRMTTEDPDNELGHFRLGQLYMEAGQYEAAAQSFRRTLELSPQFSKVYQLLGSCLLNLGEHDEAIEVLTEGYRVADQRGDKIPRDEMGKILTGLGVELPNAAPSDAARTGAPTGFRCERPGCRAGAYAQQLPGPPLPDEIGQLIYARICAECWNEWFKGYSIKVINELRLDLSTDHGQAEYDKYMRGFFGFDELA
jgi:tetratricopeptide (TPR) repeat protein